MRTLVALVLFTVAARGQADPIPVEPLTLTTPRTAVPPAAAADPLLARAEPVCVPKWRADLVLGAPTMLRAQRKLGDARVWAEGGGGLLWIWPAAFVGVRGEGRLHEGERNTFTVRPGFDVYYAQGYKTGGGGFLFPDEFPSFVMPALDFDLYWEHRYSTKVHGLLGLKLGGGLAVGNFGRGSVVPVPLVALTVGFAY